MRGPDAAFADPRLAALYDVFDDDRSDLDAYVAIIAELGAERIVDIGCGTGSLAVRLAAAGKTVVGVDPAEASLKVARLKPNADRVRWLHGDSTVLDGEDVKADLAVMTGNVAQVFVSDEDWSCTLDAVHRAVRPDGWFVFETRRVEARDWEGWDVDPTEVGVPSGGTVVVSRRVTEVALPLVTFVSTTVVDGVASPSASTLRFRNVEELDTDLRAHSFVIEELRDAPDRPGKELVILTRRVT